METALHGVNAADPAAIVETGRRVARGYLSMAAVQLLVGIAIGLAIALHYTPLTTVLEHAGLHLTVLRPLHTGATIGWIFFAGMAMVHRWMFQHLADRLAAGELDVARIALEVARRADLQRWLWTGAACLAGVALLGGYSTGREYFEYPPVLSIPIVVGWLLYACNFAVVTRFRLREMPVYAWMWGTSVFLFLWTFAEAHAWMLDVLAARPVRDLAIQWQAYGSFVGSFNLLVYGSVSWLGTQLSGDDRYARSNLAFLLFLLGVLNSFTNYGHHTYHLPQSELVKWVAFAISMTEAVLLVRVVWDCAGLGNKWAGRGRFPIVSALLVATTAWTGVQLTLAILYSIPGLNTLIHGTLAVVAHSMGSLIGIDTMALLAAGAWLTRETLGESLDVARAGVRAVVALNVGLAVLWLGLLGAGIPAGVRLVTQGVLPWAGTFPTWLGPLLMGAGLVMGGAVVVLVAPIVVRSSRAA